MKRRKTASASLDARPAAEWNSVPGEPADADDDQAGSAVADTQLDPADEQDAAEDIEHEEGEEPSSRVTTISRSVQSMPRLQLETFQRSGQRLPP